MIHEWRSYRLKPGAAIDYLALLADQGLPLVTRHLPLMGYWLAESGGLNVIHHLWAYADWAEREAARAGLAQEEGWTKGFIPQAFALVQEQENRLLHLTRSSAAYDAALAMRRRLHPARAPGSPLMAPDCAGLVLASHEGALPDAALAQFQPLSGDPRPMALLPRAADPLAALPPISGAQHNLLRPLAFSPL
ncbi:NIPSNAP family protein [Gemmobacter serpentinus]|uniref:NIPSNAP family protein n=1 Tax=Gemmobacter serpentinus TaxID=2652247 RepID=UPI0018657366|nr:NIPSNAP family protein [Gemmobacter serpentinus]